MSNDVAAVLGRARAAACSSVVQGVLACFLTTAAAAQVVFEADLAVTQHVIRQPINTISEFFPGSPEPGFRERHPFVKYYCLWNTFGSDPAQPEREIYEENASGTPIYRFERLTVHIDAIVAEGLIPFLVLGGCPLALTSQPYAISPEMGVITTGPTAQNWVKYRTFVRDLFLHLNARYGSQAVASWKYRFMSEPDCVCWWTESRDRWFTFFDYTVSGARLANPDVRIAPGNFMQGLSWLTAYAQRVQAGTFAVPGESAQPPTRFAHTYYKPWRVGGPISPSLFHATARQIRKALAPYSAFNNIPIALDEGFVGVDESLTNLWSRLEGTEWGGAHFAGLCEVLIKNDYEYAALWNPDIHDCPTPARHVLNWVHSLDGAMLLPTQQTPETLLAGHSATAIAARQGAAIAFVVTHAHDQRTGTGNQAFTLRIKNVVPGTYRVSRQRTDGTTGNYRPQWMADHQGYPRVNGSPYDQDPLSGLPASSPARQIWAQNFQNYQRLARAIDLGTTVHSTTGTTLDVPVTLPTHAVEFLVIEQEARPTGALAAITALASYQVFGKSCAARGPLPSLAAQPGSVPRTGSTLVSLVTNLVTEARPFLFIGRSNTSWNGIPLPFELGLVGLPGCQLLTSDDLVIPLANPNRTATWLLSIPLNPQLHGAVFYTQAIVFTPAFQPMSVTNGAIVTIGQ